MHEDVIENGSCSICEECNLHITGESTPLVARQEQRSNVNWCIIILLFFGLFAGVGIGTYLIAEDYQWESDQPFPMVQTFVIENKTDVASAVPLIRSHIELISVPGSPCTDDNECNIHQLSAKNATNMFNFFVDLNATVYEQLGYDNHCSNCDNNTLRIALSWINNQTEMPSKSQKYKVEDIIDYGVRHGKLTPCCRTSANTNGIDWLRFLAEEIQDDINRKYNCSS